MCREEGFMGTPTYNVVTLEEGETIEPVVDEMDGSSVSVIRRGGDVVNSAGELCLEAPSAEKARVEAGRLQRVMEVMEE